MAVVQFRVSGPAADQSLEHRLFQIGGHTLSIRQDPKGSGAHRHLGEAERGDGREEGSAAPADLGSVGLVVWQSAFVLAELLLQHPPLGPWPHVRAVDLGSGTGVVGIALALAGADALLVDLPHITPLTRANVDANCRSPLIRAQVTDYTWGTEVAGLGEPPDLITGADIVYQQEHFPALVQTLDTLAAGHTLIYLAFRLRGRGEDAFEGLLAEKDFAVERVPCSMLHPEYQGGEYRVLRACKRGG